MFARKRAIHLVLEYAPSDLEAVIRDRSIVLGEGDVKAYMQARAAGGGVGVVGVVGRPRGPPPQLRRCCCAPLLPRVRGSPLPALHPLPPLMSATPARPPTPY